MKKQQIAVKYFNLSNCLNGNYFILFSHLIVFMVKDEKQIPCQKIISGGQTGVDRAALDVCLQKNFQCGGWCPKGRVAENDHIPVKYPLKETEQSEYRFRTEKNILESDATLIISPENLIGGTLLTKQLAIKHHRPYIILSDNLNIEKLVKWLIKNNIKTLNVAGPRKSEWAEGYEIACKITSQLIDKIKSSAY